MPCTLQHAQVSAPRPDEGTILMRHDAGQLMQVSKVVNRPGREKFRQRYDSKGRMGSSPMHVCLLQVERMQSFKIVSTQAGEIH